MKVTLHPDILAHLKGKGFEGIEEHLRWSHSQGKPLKLDIAKLGEAKREKLQKLLEPHAKDRRVARAISTLKLYEEAHEHPNDKKPQALDQIPDLLRLFMRKVPGHRVYKEVEEGIWVPYVVKRSYYVEPTRDRHASANAELVYYDEGKVQTTTIAWGSETLGGRTIAELLLRHGFIAETADLRKAHLADVERWKGIVTDVGGQYHAIGRAHGSSRWRSGGASMLVEGQPVRVIVDDRDDDSSYDKESELEVPSEPPVVAAAWYKSAQDEDEDEDEDAVEEALQAGDVDEVPVHPYVLVFDTHRHEHVHVHVRNLSLYKYDKGVRSKLVLSDEVKGLVELLIENAGQHFDDVVAGKQGGAIILCAGPPGTGKTLTAEVYSEVMERPLYSVQSSQLGVNIDELEKELSRVLRRSQRWKAILLLDEADVYIHARGDDLHQNAIVGVFLRVLEYYCGVLFMTTNRETLVDDAIESRVTARIAYEVPSIGDQQRIWRILADQSGVKLSDEVIREVAEAHPSLSGRDVKNLLKLAILHNLKSRKGISRETIEYVMKFRPMVQGAKA